MAEAISNLTQAITHKITNINPCVGKHRLCCTSQGASTHTTITDTHNVAVSSERAVQRCQVVKTRPLSATACTPRRAFMVRVLTSNR